MKHESFVTIFLLVILSLTSHITMAAPPKILVTLKPLHALVAGLCAGISQPALLLDTLQSPHDYTLKPSDRRMLEAADIIIYAGNNIEGFMLPLRASLGKRQLIALDTLPGLPLLPARGTHADHAADHAADHDGHIWFSPVNAGIIVQQLAERLAQHDANNRDKYFSNRDRLLQKLSDLQKQINRQLQPVRNLPFLQFHDALQYFERDFSLTRSIVVTSGAEHTPGARHIRLLQQQVHDENIRCFLYEAPQAPNLLQTLDVNHNASMQALEIHGSQLLSGEELYFKLLTDIANKIHTCLQTDKDQKR